MIIKPADDQSVALAELETRAAAAKGAARKRLEEELRARRSGLKGEAESAYLIDFHFGDAKPNWAVIHDLRIEVDGQVAQIDHLMINRVLECYVLETKRFHAGVKINDEGEFERWNSYRNRYEGLPSPLLQNERHIELLKRAAAKLDLPTRLGVRLPLRFESLILVSPSARIIRPKHFDAGRVIKADQLRDRVWKDIDNESLLRSMSNIASFVSVETVMQVGRQLASLHRPLRTPVTPAEGAVRVDSPSWKRTTVTPAPSTPMNLSPTCKKCSGSLGQILYGQYGYYFKCAGCAANTAVRVTCQPGHKPRLRKQGPMFLRECGECGVSEIYYQNP
jgi:hypothetical protein